MAENIERRISKKVDGRSVEFSLSAGADASSPARPMPAELSPLIAPEIAEAAERSAVKRSPEFLALAAPSLPPLSRRNRAQLLMQSPNRLYFYWSVGKDPFHTLNRALGQPGGYMLVLKLVNLSTGDEELYRADESGNWWFDVNADSTYRAEIGFYSVNRPYIRILYSNDVATPRKSPSPHSANASEWRVPASRFASVLDAAGFARDAFDAALAGDDAAAADVATRSAFAQFSGQHYSAFAGVGADELRYAMFALAAGINLEELRGRISERLFASLARMADVNAARALAALKDRFEFDAEEFEVEEGSEPAVFGASLVNFPARPRKRPRKSINFAEYLDMNPVGSHSLG
ncbi:MAG: DUF4912 domain-containing protein [Acidobacteria bacterium]|nr:DUF4912 domain-containing protein [Acidobacteriota bacterium]